MNKKRLVFILLILISFTGCTQEKDYVVTIKTRLGDMVAILYDETPKHKANFIKLAKEHYYDGLLFHRVIEGFMVQGGDPDSKTAQPGQHLGNGGPGYTIEAEFRPDLFHEKGALCAARLGDQMNPEKASSGSQFYIVQGRKMNMDDIKINQQKFRAALDQFFAKPENKSYYDSINTLYQAGDRTAYMAFIYRLKNVVEKQLGVTVENPPAMVQAYTTIGGTPTLDGQYTVFGKVIKGLDVIDKITSQPKDQANRPTENVAMTVTVEELSKKKIEKLYGYHYPEKKK
jgi:cyclophilin family peptidyl-prolyl cis-trans isomerase